MALIFCKLCLYQKEELWKRNQSIVRLSFHILWRSRQLLKKRTNERTSFWTCRCKDSDSFFAFKMSSNCTYGQIYSLPVRRTCICAEKNGAKRVKAIHRTTFTFYLKNCYFVRCLRPASGRCCFAPKYSTVEIVNLDVFLLQQNLLSFWSALLWVRGYLLSFPGVVRDFGTTMIVTCMEK